MYYEERDEILKMYKQVDIFPYWPQNDSEVDAKTGDTWAEKWATIASIIIRELDTERLIGYIGSTLRDAGALEVLAYRCHPVLDVLYCHPPVLTKLTNETERSEEEKYRNAYDCFENTSAPITFNIYDAYGGLPTMSYPIWAVVQMCEAKYQESDKACALEFAGHWMSDILRSFGGIEQFEKALYKDDFSRQPAKDLVVVSCGGFLRNELPVNAYDGNVELAKEKAAGDLAELNKNFYKERKRKKEQWDVFSRSSKAKDEKRISEYREEYLKARKKHSR